MAKAKAKAKAKKAKPAKKAPKPKAKAKKPAKKPAKKAPKARAKPAKKPAGSGSVRESIEALRVWAERGGHLDGSPAASDTGARLSAPQPMWGHIMWALPPSYGDFLREHGRLAITWSDDEGFVILSPEEITEISEVVYMPSDVSRDPGKYLSTNHLVPFASAGNGECAFCFDVTQPDILGEYPVYFHHQDEPRARYAEDGTWEDAANESPDFPSFAAWLAWVAGELSAGRAPAGSSPSAFFDMPGRAA